MKFTISLLCMLAASLTRALDEESAKESTCFDIKKTVPLDIHWVSSYEHLYYPLMSRLDLYRTAQDMLKKPWADISEAELYYDGCFEFGVNEQGQSVGVGFHGKARHELTMRPLDENLEVVEFGDPNEGLAGKCYTTLTDNKTFAFFACCTNGNQMQWGVTSPLKSLPEETVQKIHKHALSLGFKKEYFTSIRYDNCGKKQSKEGKHEL